VAVPEPGSRLAEEIRQSSSGFRERLFAGLTSPPEQDATGTGAVVLPVLPMAMFPPSAELMLEGPTAEDIDGMVRSEVASATPPLAKQPSRTTALFHLASLSDSVLPAQPSFEIATEVNLALDEIEQSFGMPLIPGTSALPVVVASGFPASLPVPQIAAQITGALSQWSDGATELALSPDELGHVRLRLEPDASNPDRLVVTISFERPETLDLFRRHAGELAEALRSAGYAGADIGFGHEGGGNAPDKREGNASAGAAKQLESPDLLTTRHSTGTSLDLRL
jgi:Flagellar hook-length control protein FliK